MLNYSKGDNEYKNWMIEETKSDLNNLGKCETLMTTGNGYFCTRATTEERYLNETRNTFVAGTYNKFDENEVCELPNTPDLIGTRIEINGEVLDLGNGSVSGYSRTLNIKDGFLTRNFVWKTEKTGRVAFRFERLHSMSDIHTMGLSIGIMPLDNDIDVQISSGINGQVTNSGAQHFSEGTKRLYDSKIIQSVHTTTESGIDFVINCFHEMYKNNEQFSPEQMIVMDRRKIFIKYNFSLTKDDSFLLEKIGSIHTSRDKTWDDRGTDALKDYSQKEIRKYFSGGYKRLFAEHKIAMNKLWEENDVKISCKDEFDQLAVRFAMYHLNIMTPKHDNRMNIGAKGMTGEGYKGHVFWDTEIFMLPYFIYQQPDTARKLMEYRYFVLEGARRKARDNGHEGAMYPWECAWIDDGEVTPLWGAADIITGLPTKIWSGIIEIHITCDVAFAVWQYFKITNDIDYMEKYGYEILFDTAKFWNSRLEYKNGRYEICSVVGPDEYKEHIDNNAFTNYMVHWNIDIAIKNYDELKTKKPELFERLNKKLGLDKLYADWNDKLNKIYLPQLTENKILPQNDTYLSLKEIDLTKYKNSKNVGTMFNEYSLDQVNKIMVSKQTDALLVFYLLEDLFDNEVKKINFDFYEAHTLHDSSLSYSTHCVLANDIGERDLAYHFFKKAAEIDLGDNPKSSDAGIHAAAQGGLWQCTVNGFGGVRLTGEKLRILPNLPDSWNNIEFNIYWHNNRIGVKVDKENMSVHNFGSGSISFISYNGENTVNSGQELKLKI